MNEKMGLSQRIRYMSLWVLFVETKMLFFYSEYSQIFFFFSFLSFKLNKLIECMQLCFFFFF